MTSSLPSGDGTSTGTGPSSTLDEDALPDTGTEPDTARTAAGDEQSSASPDVSVAPDTSPSPGADAVPDSAGAPDPDSAASAAAAPAAPDADGPDAGDNSTAEGAVEGLNPAQAQGDLNPDAKPAATDKVELAGPALENDEMRRATEDLRASQDASAEAKEYAADVREQTLPGTSPTGI